LLLVLLVVVVVTVSGLCRSTPNPHSLYNMLFSTSTTMAATITWLAFLSPVVHAGWINDLRPRASGTSSCATCPDSDNSNYSLDGFSNADNALICYYPMNSEQAPTDWYCKYDSTTGVKTEDGDDGSCPNTAPVTGCSTLGKRSSTMGKETPAAQPQPAAVPLNTRSFATLKRSKLAVRRLQGSEAKGDEKK